MKNPLFSTFVWVAFLVALSACNSPSDQNTDKLHPYIQLNGEAQGTTYSISYLDHDQSLALEVDSILDSFDQCFSAWREGSMINRINDHVSMDTVFAFYDSTKYMSILWDLSDEVYRKTDGAFDPTVFPLVKAWGFFKTEPEEMSEEKIDSILDFIGFYPGNVDLIDVVRDVYYYEESYVRKTDPRIKLDFNAIAQGFSVDIIADYLEEIKGVQNYMVEIGGEVRCKGHNADGVAWRIGVDKPIDNNSQRELQSIVKVENKSVVTSGSYRKFYEKDGKRFSHTIDPRTGYPVDHNLLSATVVCERAALADAYATAFMVMGARNTVEFIQSGKAPGMDVYLIYDNNGKHEVWMTAGMQDMLVEDQPS